MKTILSCLTILVLLASCGDSSKKKILIMSKGKATVNKDAKTVTVESGTSHEEQTVDFPGGDALTMQVTTPATTFSADIPQTGYYVLNAKKDTIIGSYQIYNAPAAETKVITQDELKHRIDSLQQLLAGNVTDPKKTFYILPGKAVKITDNLGATMVGPFNSLTTLEQTGDKAPEVYKFYTSKDVRETLERVQKMTIAPPSPNQ